MSEENESNRNITPVDLGTVNVKMVPADKINLPMEAVSELNKDYIFIENLISYMAEDTRQELINEDGVQYVNTIINPNLLSWMQLKLKYIQTYWKMSGGEINNEAKKETMKLFSSILYDSLKDNPQAIEKAKELWKKRYSTVKSEK